MPISISGAGTFNGLALPTDSLKPGLVHINTTTFSAVSSVSVNSVFSATYDNYEILLYVTADTVVQARLRVAGTDNTSSNYAWQQAFAEGTAFAGERQTAQSSFRLSNANASSMTVASQSTFFDPAKAAVTQFLGTNLRNITAPSLISVAGAHNVTTAYDGVTLFPGSGTITGTIRVYGHRNDA